MIFCDFLSFQNTSLGRFASRSFTDFFRGLKGLIGDHCEGLSVLESHPVTSDEAPQELILNWGDIDFPEKWEIQAPKLAKERNALSNSELLLEVFWV